MFNWLGAYNHCLPFLKQLFSVSFVIDDDCVHVPLDRSNCFFRPIPVRDKGGVLALFMGRLCSVNHIFHKNCWFVVTKSHALTIVHSCESRYLFGFHIFAIDFSLLANGMILTE